MIFNIKVRYDNDNESLHNLANCRYSLKFHGARSNTIRRCGCCCTFVVDEYVS